MPDESAAREAAQIEDLARVMHDAYEQSIDHQAGRPATAPSRTWDTAPRMRRDMHRRVARALVDEGLLLAEPERLLNELRLQAVTLMLAAEDLEHGCDRRELAAHLREQHAFAVAALDEQDAGPQTLGLDHDRPELGWHRVRPVTPKRGPVSRSIRSLGDAWRSLFAPPGALQERIDSAESEPPPHIGAPISVSFHVDDSASEPLADVAERIRREVATVADDLVSPHRTTEQNVAVVREAIRKHGIDARDVRTSEDGQSIVADVLGPLTQGDIDAEAAVDGVALREQYGSDFERYLQDRGLVPEPLTEAGKHGDWLEEANGTDKVDDWLPIDVPCSACGAAAGTPCDRASGLGEVLGPHHERSVEALRRATERDR